MIFVADTHNQRVRAVLLDASGQAVQSSVVAGNGVASMQDGAGTSASFHHPWGLALSPDGATLYVADPQSSTGFGRVRTVRVDPSVAP